MLEELRIRNFAIIDELEVAFQGGLNIISGETGAGKSIIIGAVSLILGDRASSDQIRTSEDSASVEALFRVEGNPTVQEKLAEFGFENQAELIIRRTISRSGKNRVLVNGQLANLSMLSSLSGGLINICGQHEHQVILDAGRHLDILDEFGALMPVRAEYQRAYQEYLGLKGRLDELKALAANKLRAEEYLKFQLKEIEDAAPLPGEDTALAEEKKIIRSAAFLQEQASGSYEALYARDGSIIAQLSEVLNRIRDIKKIDAGLAVSLQDLESAAVVLDEASLSLREYLKRLTFDPARLEAMEDRLELLGRLKRKYGGSLEEVLKKAKDARRELDGLSSADEEIAKLSAQLETLGAKLMDLAAGLSGMRRQAAGKLKAAVEREIRQLKMEHARFEVSFKPKVPADNPLSVLDARGMDEVEFFLSPNVGEDVKPLNRIASGGELSRIVLGLKKVLATTGSVGTVIFDEVDSGIGGAVAEVVGEKLRDVAKSHQIICITHLPQIACFGDAHFVVSKAISGQRTKTQISPLSENERPEEIARMLAGLDITEKTRAHAREMLKAAGSRRRSG